MAIVWPQEGRLAVFFVFCAAAEASQLELLYVASPTSKDDEVDELGHLSPNITKGRMHFHANCGRSTQSSRYKDCVLLSTFAV